mmetsp:Transcript_58454/g.139449  ORF Transcript_58454/g.139449 Transcript_58454/m.139449 type:complete len:204 (-) Transcript_58454:145-756(-)
MPTTTWSVCSTATATVRPSCRHGAGRLLLPRSRTTKVSIMCLLGLWNLTSCRMMLRTSSRSRRSSSSRKVFLLGCLTPSAATCKLLRGGSTATALRISSMNWRMKRSRRTKETKQQTRRRASFVRFHSKMATATMMLTNMAQVLELWMCLIADVEIQLDVTHGCDQNLTREAFGRISDRELATVADKLQCMQSMSDSSLSRGE